jgi:Protein of unknown function (DUF3299)
MSQAISEINEVTQDHGDSDFSDDFSYRSLSRAAMLCLVFGLFGLLAWISPMLLFLPVIGFVFGIVALRNLKRYPEELVGKPITVLGLILSVAMVIGAPAWHIYVYNTEVPEGFERVSFASLQSPNPAFDFPTPEAWALNGKKIFLKGYVHPTSISSNSSKMFVLVPDWSTCCFGKQPPLTHMIQVRLVNEDFAYKSVRQHSIAGTFEVHDFKRAVEGLDGVFYELQAEHFK